MIKYKRNKQRLNQLFSLITLRRKFYKVLYITKKCNAGFSNGRLSGEINIICFFYAISKEEDIL